MGIFSRNFNKPGPGVSKDEPRKKGTARLIELLGRHFGDLVKLNLLFCLCVAPSVVVFILSILFYNPITQAVAFILSLVLAFPVGGVITSCVYYVTKMMRDDPSYVWFEFKRKFVENFKQAAPMGILCTAFVYAQVLLWISFVASDPATGNLLLIVAALLSLVVFGMITPYIFLHFAYVELGTFKIIKNSVLMSFGYLPRSFMGSILGGIIWTVFALFFPASMLLFFPVIIFFGVTLSMLLCMMWTWAPFDKHFKVEETLVARMQEAEGKQG